MNLDSVVAAAQRKTGLEDIGDETILEGLRVLVEAIEHEARLNVRGYAAIETLLVDNLASRLRVVDHLKRHSALLEQPVEKPMFVFGLPRTGTTLTINLLAEDPTRRCFMRFEARDPVPPPQAGTFRQDPRYRAEHARLEKTLQHAPHIAAMHYEEADGPTECQFAMAPSFCAQLFDSQLHVPSYRRWLLATSYLPAFRYHKQLLQLLQSEAPGRWTLKNPWHPLFLDDLTTVYPDAQLVMTHRDPAEVVASACSLVQAVREMYSDHADPQDVAAAMIETFDAMIARSDAYRARHGAETIHDIGYKELMNDPIGEMRRLYARFGEDLTPEAETTMTAHLQAHPKGKHGRHDYKLERFGLTRDSVRAHFRDYCERFRL